MKYRELGRTGIKVSEVGFGGWPIGGNRHGNSYGATDDKISLDAIEKALDLGCNFFDTADVYGWGHSEELLGKAFRGKRDRVVIATKVGSDFYQGYGFQTFDEVYVRFALDKSLERLQTDYLDLYQLHNPPSDVLEAEETYSVLMKLKNEGRIRAWGVSARNSRDAQIALMVSKPDSIQVPYNIFATGPEQDLFPLANQVGCAIIAREPLSNGFLTGKYDIDASFDSGDMRKNWPRDFINARVKASQQLNFLVRNGSRTLTQAAIQWVLQSKIVSAVIPGIKTAEHADEDMTAPDAPKLKAEELDEIATLIRDKFGL
ncbi:MAG: aldo/keto reductase [Candidatus Melainabacteria bacterium]|nr:aldo/keto reductase [Candidatus Melainabacteria bacterium]